MSKKIILFFVVFLFSGCAESNLARTGFNTLFNYGVKQKTGKSTVEHALNFVETQGNPKLVEDKKDKDKQD